MSAYHRTTAAIARARHARARVVLPAECWRCHRIIAEGQPFEMGHTVDVALGGAESELRPEHKSCNRTAGGRLGGKAKAARARRPSAPSW